MAPPSLLGPPEFRNQPPPPQAGGIATTTTTTTTTAAAAAAVALPRRYSRYSRFNSLPRMGYTENGSATFLSSGNPCLDLFFHVVPDTPPKSLKEWLRLAWAHDPLTTLKLICNLRGVRGTGKSDKEGFYTAAHWLHNHHPKTLACNLDSFAEFGYFKDLPEILYRLLEGPEVRQIQKQEWDEKKMMMNLNGFRHNSFRNKPKKQTKSLEIKVPEKAKVVDLNVTALRKEKKIAKARKVIDRYSNDPDYRFLYECVSDLFAEFLKADMESMKAEGSGKRKSIGLAAKWCPSINSSFDKSTLLCESIAKKMFPLEDYPEYQGIEEGLYAYLVRDRLRREVLVPLRQVLELPEVYSCANKWDQIPYKRVASLAMKFYRAKFYKHDKDRFAKYLEDVKSGKTTITAGALLPHEIIASLDDVAELQWERMVNDLLNKGKLRNCMAICDVSGSMHGTPMGVSVALGLLVSELSEEPWKGKLITFSANPQLQMVKGQSLREKTDFIRRMDWGMNTNFQKVFDLILEVAVQGKLEPEQMIKRLFVFSDMEFDRASSSPWETDYKVIVSKFTAKGYGDAIPQIVFWNLRDSRATPVTADQKGVALVSGFSKNLMKMFLDQDGDIDPEAIMEAAISGQEYQKLVVFD